MSTHDTTLPASEMSMGMQIVLVTGGRDFDRRVVVWQRLDEENARLRIGLLVTGACPSGADHDAELWAKRREVPYLGIPASWSTLGRSAGPRRNTRMVKFLGIVPDKCMAFPGGSGTADMVKKAKAAGIHVEEVT